MNPRTFFVGLAGLALAGAVLFLSHYHYSWLAALLVLLPSAYHWFSRGRNREAILATLPSAIVGLSVVVLIGISKPPFGQAVLQPIAQTILTLGYAGWLFYARQLRLRRQANLLTLGVQQFLAICAIFLATAYWHWPQVLVVALVCLVTGISTLHYLGVVGERASNIVAISWALVAGEIAWVLTAWQVNYIIHDGLIIIPQAAIVILGIGYCYATILHSHRTKKLSRRRLIECVAIAGVLLAIVIAGTRWNGIA